MCSIGNIKLEGWSLEEGGGGERRGEGGGERRGEGGGGGGAEDGGEGREEGEGVEGREGKRWGYTDNENAKVKLRLIAGETNIRFTLKRKLEDCSILHTRVVVRLGDVMWILSRSQLQAVSRLIQTLMTAALMMSQRQRLVRHLWYMCM